MMEQVFFYIFSIIAVISAISVISARSAVRSAFYLIITLMQVAAIFILLRSPFLAAVQVFIYVGAVMVLFLFAVMVLDIGREKLVAYMHHQSVIAVPAVIVFFIMGAYMIIRGGWNVSNAGFPEAALAKSSEVIGKEMFGRYLFPFEVVSLVLLIALIGAVALVLRGREKDKQC
ncbi:NADH-quinone oxidoreductase subunit J [bacterium]|nr:MAG: NADH-quinone oxidoreductase subunit J [bacterium]